MDFFTRAFGFKQRFIHESGDYGELSTGKTKLAFSSTELMKQLNKNPRAPSPANPTFEIAFESDNVAADLSRAIDAGATRVQEARDGPWGQTTSYVTDPNGYLIGQWPRGHVVESVSGNETFDGVFQYGQRQATILVGY